MARTIDEISSDIATVKGTLNSHIAESATFNCPVTIYSQNGGDSIKVTCEIAGNIITPAGSTRSISDVMNDIHTRKIALDALMKEAKNINYQVNVWSSSAGGELTVNVLNLTPVKTL